MHHSSKNIKDYITSYIFLIPGLALFLIFYIYPFLQSYILSFQDWSGFTIMKTAKFIGWDNYKAVFEDRIFWDSIVRVFKVTFIIVIFETPLCLFLAILVNNLVKSSLYRLIFFIPTILSGIIVGMVWKWMYEPSFGIVNKLLETLGLDMLKHIWLGQSETAMGAIAVTFIWQTFGTYFLLLLVGVSEINNELYEASKVEGASSIQNFAYITFPLLIPTIVLVVILLLLGSMQIFGQIVMMTNGGPGYATEVPSLRILKEAFEYFKMSYATALSVVFGLILVILSMIQLYVSKRYRGQMY